MKFRVNPSRLSAAAYGEYHPITTNATKKGRAKNRRVDIIFFAQKKSVKGKTIKSVLDIKKR
jgi:chemotaxis protein MotB